MLLVLDKAIAEQIPSSAYGRYYVAGGPWHTWKDLASALNDAMFAAKVIPRSQASSVSLERSGFLGP